MKDYLSLIILFVITACIIRCNESSTGPDNNNAGRYIYNVPEQINDGWQTASMKSVGMDSSKLEVLVERVNSKYYKNIHSVVIIRNNRLVFEQYWKGNDFGMNSPNYLGREIEFNRTTRHNTHSATKSVTSALVGIAIDKGFITNENDSIFKYLPYHRELNTGGKDRITIKHMLTMSSGLQWNEGEVLPSQTENDVYRFNQSGNPIAYLLSKPLVAAPGTRYYYNGGGVDLLGELVKNATRQTIPNFSRDNLFAPLGITNYTWITLYPSGITACHGDIYITPRDMAKFGFLFLNNGLWNGTRIISEEWIRKSIQNQISPGVYFANGYGYLWWLRNLTVNGHSYSCYKAMGWGGQEIFVFPSLNMVVVFTGANYMTDPVICDEIVRNYILSALN